MELERKGGRKGGGKSGSGPELELLPPSYYFTIYDLYKDHVAFAGKPKHGRDPRLHRFVIFH